MQRRAQFQQFLSSNSSLSVGRYFRLMALATAELLFNIPITSYGMYLNITSRPIYPWKSWSDTHLAWYVIDTYPGLLWRSQKTQVVILELSRWSLIFCAFVFFAFFGFADEARRNYKRAYQAVLKKLEFSPARDTKKDTFTQVLYHGFVRVLTAFCTQLIQARGTTVSYRAGPTITFLAASGIHVRLEAV